MTDLEMTKLCAEAMGWHTRGPASKVVAYKVSDCAIVAGNDRGGESVYDPLRDDAQAMALVKKLDLSIQKTNTGYWQVCGWHSGGYIFSDDLNRAIVECAAALQAACSSDSY